MRIVSFFLLISFGIALESCHTTTPETIIPPVTDTLKQYGTPFANVPAPTDAFLYQVNIRAFGPHGDFAGVIARLDSIQKLGVNVIYLMPTYPVGVAKSVNSPYCVRNYTGVNTEFGTLTDLRAIVDGAHSRNMAVMMDWVANHTSWDNDWITSHPAWYLQDGSGNILSPPNTNFTDVAQLNFSVPAMRLQMIQDMKYWVYTANVDGFRCDFADNPPSDFWTQAIDTLRKISSHKLLMLAEGSRSNNYTSGFDYNFGFNYYGNIKSIFGSGQSVTNIDAVNTADYVGATGDQQIVRYLTNHDVNSSDGTPLDLFGGKTGSMAAFIVTAYMKGVPMIYNGQEVATPVKITFPFTTVKIDWTINPDVTAQYKKVVAFRNSNAAIRKGALVSYSTSDVCVFTKTLATDKILVISNLRNKAIDLTLPAALANTAWKNVFNNNAAVNLTTDVQLQPYSYLVLESN